MTNRPLFRGIPALLLICAVAAAAPNITTSSLPPGAVGSPYNQNIMVNGQKNPVTWSVSSGSVPPGLNFGPGNGNNANISGTPTTPGTYAFSVRIVDSSGESDTQPFSIRVDPAPLTVATSSLPAATFNTPYSATLEASGGSGGYIWLRTSGSLPAGLTLSTAGIISGTPTGSGTSNFTVMVTDSGARTASKALSITVNVPALSVTTASLPNGAVGVAYSQALSATGGSGGYTWSRTQGALPAGLALSSSGTIAGTPTAAGASTFTVQVADSGGRTATKSLTITIDPNAPTVTTASLAGGQVGQAYSETLAAAGGSGGYTWAVTAGTLPAGLSLNPSGAIAGTPSAAGTSNFTVTVTDNGGRTGSKALTITISPATLAVTTASLPSGQVAMAYSQTLQASGGTQPYSWSVTSGALPAGLTLAASGAITGTPTASGTATFTVTVTDSGNRTASKQLSIAIDPALAVTTASLPGGIVGVAYSATLQASGGTGGYRWSVTAGALPAGLTISQAGEITGTPTAAGAPNFTVTVSDSTSHTASRQLAITIDPPLTVTTATLPAGTVGVAYSQTLAASGGSGGYTWAVTAGALPAGLTINPAGEITGTPSAAATSTFTATVTDSGSRTASKQLSIAVEFPALTISTASLENGTVGVAYSQTLAATGGSGGYRWSSSGALPAGLTLNANGTISGTPTAGGASTFTATVTDSGNRTVSKQLSITIDFPSLTVSTASLENGTVGVAYSQTLEATGGSGGYRWSSSGSLPAGLTLNANGTITGTPTAGGASTFTATVTDSGSRTASKQLSITIDFPTLTVSTASLPAATVGVAYSQTLQATGGSGEYKWSVSGGSLPAGLTLSNGGVLSGTPTAAGTREFTVTVTDSGNRTATKTLSVAVNVPALTVTTATLPAGIVGGPYSQQLASSGGSGGNAWSVSAGNLPAGLTLSGGGVIAGVPTTPGTSNFTVQVRDSANATATRQLTLTISPTTLVITTQALPAAVQGAAYAQTLAASGGSGAYRWSIDAGSLPTGLTLEPSGRIAGTVTGSSSTVTIAVEDGAGVRIVKIFSIAVTPPLRLPPANTLPTGVTGTAYNGTVAAQGGQAPYTFSVATGQLPPGLALDSRTGAITGRPSQVGEFTFTILARDAANAQSQANYTIAVANTLTIVNPPVLPTGSVGVAYQVTLTAAGGSAPYSWSAIAGSLPAGLSFRADGTIEGSPASAGSFTFTAAVTDALGGRTTKEFTLTIAATLTITTAPQLPQGVPTVPYNTTLAAGGGTPPYVWTIVSGALPGGLRLDAATGAITGVPTGPIAATFTAAVTDSLNVTAQKAFTLTVAPGLTFSSPATLPGATAGTAYSFTLAATGGTQPYSWRISDGALPSGLALNAASGVISGTASDAGTFNFTVEVADTSGLKTSRVHTLVVDLPTVATLRLSGVPATLAPLQQPQVDVVIVNPYPVAITGRLNLAFVPATGMPDDPAVQFSSGGRSVSFTIAANDTRASFSVPRLLIQSGSVAGTLQFTVESLRAGTAMLPTPSDPIGSAQVPAAAAVVRSVEVRRTSGGFELLVVGASTTRELSRMTVRFRPPAGATLQTTEVTVDLADPARAWFQSSGSSQYGGQFTVTMPFSFVGGPSAIESVGVVLANNVGPSQEASGPY